MIKVGDIVCWYENGHTAKKKGQVITISGEKASVLCDKEGKIYSVDIKDLKKV